MLEVLPRPARFYKPVKLDIASLDLPAEWHDFVLYLLNLIRWRWCCWRADAEGYVRLKARYLDKFIPNNIRRQIVLRLAERKVIEIDTLKKEGVKCRGYRITPEYWETHAVYCTDVALNRKIHRYRSKIDKNLRPVHRWLRSKLSLIHFDIATAAPIIGTLKPDSGSRLAVRDYRVQRMENARTLADGERFFSVDRFGRCHTPITSLERELRCCLSVAGEKLVCIDLANSQPLMLAIFARQYFRSRVARRRFLDKSFADRRSPYCLQEVRQMANCPTDRLPADLKKFIEVCEQGGFYESLMSELEKAKGKKGRDRFKKRFYRVLFGRNRARHPRFRNEVKARFANCYPSAAKVLKALKRRNYRHSSHVLQNYEATLFIGIICERIRKERPDIMVCTIHDSILTTPDAVRYVKAVVLAEFQKLGVTPTLHREHYRER